MTPFAARCRSAHHEHRRATHDAQPQCGGSERERVVAGSAVTADHQHHRANVLDVARQLEPGHARSQQHLTRSHARLLQPSPPHRAPPASPAGLPLHARSRADTGTAPRAGARARAPPLIPPRNPHPQSVRPARSTDLPPHLACARVISAMASLRPRSAFLKLFVYRYLMRRHNAPGCGAPPQFTAATTGVIFGSAAHHAPGRHGMEGTRGGVWHFAPAPRLETTAVARRSPARAVLVEFAVERLAIQAEDLRRACLVAANLAQDLEDVLAFQIAQRDLTA